MSRLVVINLGLGSLQSGFPSITVQVSQKRETRHPMQFRGSLPPASEIAQLYDQWQLLYQAFYRIRRSLFPPQSATDAPSIRKLAVKAGGVTRFSEVEFYNLAQQLKTHLNTWLKAKTFLNIDQQLRARLDLTEEIRIIIETDDELLQHLPWHGWDLFRDYRRAEVALSRPEYKRWELSRPQHPRRQVRILAILGNSKGINLEAERQFLECLSDAETHFLVQPKRREFNMHLWDPVGWDLLFFAGHSHSEGETGRIYLNDDNSYNSLTIEELEAALNTAIERGLKLAIFNSCEGLGLANALAKLDLPQVIIMREPVPNFVAQEFFRHFLEAFAQQHLSLYLAVQEARKKLQGLEDSFPAASWLPIICQNPTVEPPTWSQLGGLSPCPYRGLCSFREEDAPFFFGREVFTERLVAAVKRRPLVSVVGASGSGKSSVVFAGLIPRLRATLSIQIAAFRPGPDPYVALAAALAPLYCPEDRDPQQVQLELVGMLRDNPAALPDLIGQITQVTAGTRLLVVADQFEELCTLCSKSDCYSFLDCLLNAVEKAPAFTLVLTLRADFLGQALAYQPFGQALQHYPPELLIAMDPEEMERAVVMPAAAMNVRFEKGLIKRIVDDVGYQPGSLPLLEFALTQLWDRQENGGLTHQAYETIGGVEEALANHAEAVYAQFSETDRQRAQRVFIQLVCPGEGTEETRRLATRDEVKEENWDLVTRLANARLVVTSRDEVRRTETVEVVHEALIRSWGRLEQWMRTDGEFRRWQEQLRTAMQQWESSDRDDGVLLRGKPLADAEEWQRKRHQELSEAESTFIQASLEQRDRQIKREKRQLVLLRSLLGLVSGTLVVAIAISLVAFDQFLRTQQQVAIKKAALVRNSLTTSPLEGLVRAIEAAGSSQSFFYTLPQEVQSSLLEAIHVARKERIERNILKGHDGLVSSVVFSPDGQMIASGSFDKTIRLWDLDGNPIGQPFQGHEDKVRSVAFSPDGQTIASGSDDRTVRLWDRQGNPIGQPFRGHEKPVFSVAFSPDGQTIASGSFDKTVRLWELQGHPVGQPFRGHEDFVISVAFSPDGQTIASGSDDRTVRLWDRQGNPIGQPFRGHEDFVATVAFSPDGQTIASGSFDKTVRLWNLDGRLMAPPFQGHNDVVYSVAFSPDGQTIASGSFDKTLRLWDLNGKPLGQPLRGHEAVVRSVAFSPNGQFFVSSSADRTLRLWTPDNDPTDRRQDHQDAVLAVAFSPNGQFVVSGSADRTLHLWDQTGNPIGKPFRGHQASVTSVVFSPDGQSLISGSADRTLRLWDQTGNPIGKPFRGHQASVTSVAFSPDGQSIISGSTDKTLRLWDRQGNPVGQAFQGHRDVVLSVAFSPDGQYIVSGSFDTTIRLWDRQGNPIGQPFQGHEGFVSSVAFSPDGQFIVSGSDDTTIRLWDRQGNPIGPPFRDHEGAITAVAFSPDGEHVLSSSADRTLRLWDRKGNPVGQPFRGHEQAVRAVDFGPNGQHIVSGSDDTTVRLWERQGNWRTWLQTACERLHGHVVLTQPQTEEARRAHAICQELAWEKEAVITQR